MHLFIFSSSRPQFSCVLLFKRSSVMRFFDLYTFVFRTFASVTFCPALIKGALLFGALLSLHLHKYPSSHPFYMVFEKPNLPQFLVPCVCIYLSRFSEVLQSQNRIILFSPSSEYGMKE